MILLLLQIFKHNHILFNNYIDIGIIMKNKTRPNLTIIGEESISYTQPINLPDTNIKLYDEGIFNKTHDNHIIRTQYEIDDLCVWVDPLDGTLDFVKGDYENVTTLIGVSYKK